MKYKPGWVYSYKAMGQKCFVLCVKENTCIKINMPPTFRGELFQARDDMEERFSVTRLIEEFDLSGPEVYKLLCKLTEEE